MKWQTLVCTSNYISENWDTKSKSRTNRTDFQYKCRRRCAAAGAFYLVIHLKNRNHRERAPSAWRQIEDVLYHNIGFYRYYNKKLYLTLYFLNAVLYCSALQFVAHCKIKEVLVSWYQGGVEYLYPLVPFHPVHFRFLSLTSLPLSNLTFLSSRFYISIPIHQTSHGLVNGKRPSTLISNTILMSIFDFFASSIKALLFLLLEYSVTLQNTKTN